MSPITYSFILSCSDKVFALSVYERKFRDQLLLVDNIHFPHYNRWCTETFILLQILENSTKIITITQMRHQINYNLDIQVNNSETYIPK